MLDILGKKIQLSTSAWLLIASNLFPIVGVLFFNFDILYVFLLYWAESGIIGFFSILKIICVKPKFSVGDIKIPGSFITLGKLIYIPFFCFHFGMFMMAHLAFIFAFFSFNSFTAHSLFGGFSLVIPYLQFIWLGLILLVISHGYSFVFNFIKKREYENMNIRIMMFQPYRRIAVMHVSLIFGVILYIFSGEHISLLIILIFAKVYFDLRSHQKERERFETTITKT